MLTVMVKEYLALPNANRPDDIPNFVWRDVAEKLATRGYTRSVKQCRERWVRRKHTRARQAPCRSSRLSYATLSAVGLTPH